MDKATLAHLSFDLQGLRERNWTSRHFREISEPWKIEIYEDSGRLLAPSWSGFRATVTQADGSMRWVDMPTAGAESYTEVSSSQLNSSCIARGISVYTAGHKTYGAGSCSPAGSLGMSAKDGLTPLQSQQ